MKVIDLWKSDQKTTISFELFPARSAQEGSRQLIQKLKHEKGLDILAYFACFGLSPEEISSVLDSYQAIGVESLLAVRGDAPRKSFEPHPDSLPYASDLVAFIRQRYAFCLGVAAYPEGHVDAPDRKKDLEYLKLKVDQGGEYIITNYFYDTRYFFDFVDRCRGIGIEVPIVPGIMPIYSIKMLEMLAGMCGATITEEVHEGLASLDEGDKDALIAFGIEFAYRQCAELLQAGVPGLHIYTMNRSASTVGLVNQLRAEELL
jgi:methylenetetrahydrofolate reductase (NADPH)